MPSRRILVADGKVLSNGIVYEWVYIEVRIQTHSAGKWKIVPIAERQEVSKAIIYDWVYIELTVHTHVAM